MILGAEVALLIYGIWALIKASYSLGKDRKVTGNKARILGFISLMPLPLSFFIGIIAGVFIALINQSVNPLIFTVIELIMVIVVVVIIYVLGNQFYKQQQEALQQKDFQQKDFQQEFPYADDF